MYLVDTNIFLEVMLSRSKAKECERFLALLKSGEKTGFVTDFSVHSIIVIMGSYGRKRELKEFLRSLTAYEGLAVYNTSLSDEIKAVDLSAKTGLDLDDAIQYSVALSLGAEGIVSLDKHFDGREVERVARVVRMQG